MQFANSVTVDSFDVAHAAVLARPADAANKTPCEERPQPMVWFQKELTLPAAPRGYHLVTDAVRSALPQITNLDCGLLHVFIQHTSASLTINENADPDVRHDFEIAMNSAIPEHLPFRHTLEGADDMPAHVKASLLGSSVSVPIRNGALALGTWQGIYLCEHRDHGTPRRLLLTVHGSE